MIIAAEGVLDILFSWPHWIAELTVEFATGVVLYPLARLVWRRAVRRHDQEHHGG